MRSVSRMSVVALLVLVLGTAGCDWQQFGNDAANTRSSADPGINAVTVPSLAVSWIGTTAALVTTAPAIVNGVAYVGSNDKKLYAFASTVASGCTGTPPACAPLWTARLDSSANGAPAVANGLVITKSSAGTVSAFDAAGVNGCSGIPKVCAPVWAASVGAGASSPTVAGGQLYVATATGLKVFDAAGVAGCSGTPVVCVPLWTAPMIGSPSIPAIANGLVFVGASRLYAFDAAGVTNCSGVPKQCNPVWSTAAYPNVGVPSVADGRVFVPTSQGILAFDAAGANGCSGAPTTCSPVWTTGTGATRSLAIAKGVVYSTGGLVEAFDGAGVNGCTGTPIRCTPMWTAEVTSPTGLAPAVANGVLYVPSSSFELTAFDATGATGCSGTPIVCVPLWSGGLLSAPGTAPAVARGVVYVGSGNALWAFAPTTYQRPTCGTNPHFGLSPCDIQDAYRLPSATAGTGKSIAIVDAFDDPNAESDLAVYRTAYGLPPCTSANGCFQKLNQRGSPGAYPAADPGWAVEISLDLDMVSAACPRCRITLVESDNDSFASILAAETVAIGTRPAAVSNSFGGPEDPNQVNLDRTFSSKNVAIVAASGDGGYGLSYPASSPNVVAVGGTNLLADSSSARGWTEIAWNGAGSGCSAYEAKPAWQNDPGCTKRTVADVSAIAGSPGLAVYDSYGGVPGWITVQGTSASTPIVASIYGLAPTVGSPRNLWGNPGSLFDVVSGSNGTCAGSYLCTAQAGFDGPTGNGSPCGTGAFSILPMVSAGCSTVSASARVSADGALRVEPLPTVPVCPAVPPGRMRCLVLRVTG